MPKSAYSTHVTRLSRDSKMAYKWNADLCILLCFLVVLTLAGGYTLSDNQDANNSFERRFLLDPTSGASTEVNPPEQKDFCADLFPDSCRLLIIQDTNLCKDPQFSHYACREFCGTCSKTVVIPTTVTTPQLPTTDCFYDSTKYMGAYTTTVTGKTCRNWAELDPTLQGLPDVSITVAGNKCRDPDGRGFPWCFTSNTFDWEFCPVPYCQECFYWSQSENYAGYVSMDKDNNTCSSWSDYVAQTGDTSVKFPNNSVADAKNYCRDPKGSGIPKCNVNGVLKECDVPQCSHECRDDPETNCALVQQYVCKYEYASVTLCAKTCNMCKFGLLPPKKVDPPADICVDNPDANCAILQSIICPDTEGALKLCPRTCQLCSRLYGHMTSGPITSKTTVRATMTSSTQTSPMTLPATTLQMTGPTTTPSTPTNTKPATTTPATSTLPYWLPWGAWACKEQSGFCYQNRFRACSTGVDQDCKTSQGGIAYNVGLCTEISCPGLLYGHTTRGSITSPTTVRVTMTSSTTTSSTTTIPMTSPTTTPTTTKPTTTTTTLPYWLPWGAWACKEQSGSCFQNRFRVCSTGVDQDCKNSQGGIAYNVGLCTEISCPEYFTTTTKAPDSTPKGNKFF